MEAKEAYIRFMAPMNPQTVDRLIRAVDDKYAKGYTKVHLLISSPGGTVFHGISLYNFLRGMPMDVATYNFGSVDSIGVILFCAGKERFSAPNARFLIHDVRVFHSGNFSFDERQTDEMLKGLKIDKENIANIISDTTGTAQKEIIKMMHDRTTFSPTEAKAFGLVTEIKHELVPRGAELITINEIEPPQQAMPKNSVENVTDYFDRGIRGTYFKN